MRRQRAQHGGVEGATIEPAAGQSGDQIFGGTGAAPCFDERVQVGGKFGEGAREPLAPVRSVPGGPVAVKQVAHPVDHLLGVLEWEAQEMEGRHVADPVGELRHQLRAAFGRPAIDQGLAGRTNEVALRVHGAMVEAGPNEAAETGMTRRIHLPQHPLVIRHFDRFEAVAVRERVGVAEDIPAIRPSRDVMPTFGHADHGGLASPAPGRFPERLGLKRVEEIDLGG